MKTLFIDCGMGAAGDMLTAALLELIDDKDGFLKKLNDIGIPNVTFEKESSVKCGITGTHISVKVKGIEEGEEHTHRHTDGHSHDNEHSHGSHSHSHNDMTGIEHIVNDHLDVPKNVKNDILSVYKLIAEAESEVHGVPVSEIHFHEVGNMDAVADITAVCLLMNELAPSEVVVSPIHVGSGNVKCAHGILPVPAPATAYILKGIPMYGGEIKGELCTPTGAALLKHFATRFGKMPVMRTEKIGYGMGKKDFDVANCVRVFLGETDDKEVTVTNISFNVDDMTAEAVGFAINKFLEEGAYEAFSSPVNMKKSRPGALINVICKNSDKERMAEVIFKHTTTIGMRFEEMGRFVLDRKLESLDTPYGKVRRKISSGYGVKRVKYEYDDLVRIAEEKDISIEEARKLVTALF